MSDFGISIWRDNEGQIKKKPLYTGSKSAYELENLDDSFQFSFDIRYLIAGS